MRPVHSDLTSPLSVGDCTSPELEQPRWKLTPARISTASDILLVSKSDLARKFGRGNEAEKTAQGLIDATNRALMPKAKRASEMGKTDEVRIEGTPFSCRVGGITEIVGER